MRNALVHAGKTQRRVVSAFVGTAFAQDDEAAAKAQWRQVADHLRPRVPKLAAFMDAAETDVLAYMSFPKDHRTKIHSNNPIERLNGEIKRAHRGRRHLPKRGRYHPPRRRYPARTNDEWGGSALPLHDDGIRRPFER